MASTFYVNSFRPLVASRAGVTASEEYGLPPFIDGSIRREPDFEHPQPVITCLCRADRFAPRLVPGDHVTYLTVKGRYKAVESQRRLIAVFRVERLFDTHADAAAWFSRHGLRLPNNLMVKGNPPNPLNHSHRCNSNRDLPEKEWHRNWDLGYHKRARAHGRVVGCSVLFVDPSWSAPVVSENVLVQVFGRVPGTRNPGRQEITRLHSLLEHLGIEVPPSRR